MNIEQHLGKITEYADQVIFEVFQKYISKISSKFNLSKPQLENIWKDIYETHCEQQNIKQEKNKVKHKCEYTYHKGAKSGQTCGANVRKGGIYCSRHKKFESVVFHHKMKHYPVGHRPLEDPKKIIIRKLRNTTHLWHPTTRLVFRSKESKQVFGVHRNGEIEELTVKDIDVCKRWGFAIENKNESRKLKQNNK